METDIFTELMGRCLELREAFVSMNLQLSSNCKVNIRFFLQVEKLRLRKIPWLAEMT